MNMKLTLAAGAAALAVLALAGCSSMGASSSSSGSDSGSSSASGSSGSSAAGTTGAAGALSTASTSLGTIVVDGAGMTAYFYDLDKKGESASACTGGCSSAWPAITTTSSTPSVAGVTGTVGTIAGPDGARQITIDGLPIYRYAGDAAKGDVSGQGSGGVWWAVNPDGTEDKGTTGAAAGGSSSPQDGGAAGTAGTGSSGSSDGNW